LSRSAVHKNKLNTLPQSVTIHRFGTYKSVELQSPAPRNVARHPYFS